MLPEDRDQALIGDMLAFAFEVDDFCAGVSLKLYQESLDVRRKIERSLELVGEASKRVSPAFQASHPEISGGASPAFATSSLMTMVTSTTPPFGMSQNMIFRSSSRF